MNAEKNIFGKSLILCPEEAELRFDYGFFLFLVGSRADAHASRPEIEMKDDLTFSAKQIYRQISTILLEIEPTRRNAALNADILRRLRS